MNKYRVKCLMIFFLQSAHCSLWSMSHAVVNVEREDWENSRAILTKPPYFNIAGAAVLAEEDVEPTEKMFKSLQGLSNNTFTLYITKLYGSSVSFYVQSSRDDRASSFIDLSRQASNPSDEYCLILQGKSRARVFLELPEVIGIMKKPDAKREERRLTGMIFIPTKHVVEVQKLPLDTFKILLSAALYSAKKIAWHPQDAVELYVRNGRHQGHRHVHLHAMFEHGLPLNQSIVSQIRELYWKKKPSYEYEEESWDCVSNSCVFS